MKIVLCHPGTKHLVMCFLGENRIAPRADFLHGTTKRRWTFTLTKNEPLNFF